MQHPQEAARTPDLERADLHTVRPAPKSVHRDPTRHHVAKSEATKETTREEYFGQVVADDTGEPLAGAFVTRDSEMASGRDARASRTDHSGVFSVTVDPTDVTTHLWRVSADGYGDALIRILPHGPQTTRSHPRTVKLRRAGNLTVHITDPTGWPIPGVRVEVVVSTGHAAALYPWDVLTWVATVDGGGDCRFDNLPAGVLLRVRATLPKEPGVAMESSLSLAPGEARLLEWNLGRGGTVVVRIVDQFGAPLGGAPAYLTKISHRLPEGAYQVHYVSAGEAKRAMVRAAADTLGAVRFSPVPPGEWLIGTGTTDIARVGVVVSIEAGQAVEILLPTASGLFIRGQVVGDDQIAGLTVWGAAEQMLGNIGATTGANGEFTLGPVVNKPHHLSLDQTKSMLAYPGDEEVRISHSKDRGWLHVTLGPLNPEDAPDVRVTVTGKSTYPRTYSGVGRDGSLRIEIKSGTYALAATSRTGAVGIMQEALVVDDEVSYADITLERGVPLRLNYDGGTGVGIYRVSAPRGAIIAQGRILPNTTQTVYVPSGWIVALLDDGREERVHRVFVDAETHVNFTAE